MMGEMIRQQIRMKLYHEAESTKAELAQSIGISFPTISKVLDEMNDSGEVLLTGLAMSSGGRRPKTYKLNPEHMTGLAVYLEKEFTSYFIVNYEGEIIGREKLASVLQVGPEHLAEQIESFMERFQAVRVLTLGVPGAVNNGRVFHIPGYEKFKDFDFKSYYEGRLSLRVEVENDMNATAIGYYDRIANEDKLSLAYLYLGSNGPGAGIIVNGQVVRGKTFFSGEVSFVPLSGDKSFVQLLDDALAIHDSDESRHMLMDAISRLVVAFTAIINPHIIVFCSSELTELDLVQIRRISASLIPEANLPNLVTSDWEQDYMSGLHQLTVRSMMTVS